ncbi:Hypothetical_protein [Hexamita inflata]|uniref:Hypothetical_protein n=1 Tax=Hexamita inflata TaxID=28002 RepID=A0ABP1HFH5_9EUKA
MFLIFSRTLCSCFDHFSIDYIMFQDHFPALQVTLYPSSSCNLPLSVIELHATFNNESRLFYRHHSFKTNTVIFHCLGSLPLVKEQFCFDQLQFAPEKAFVYVEFANEVVFEPENWASFRVVISVLGSVFTVGLVFFVVVVFILKAKERKPIFQESTEA